MSEIEAARGSTGLKVVSTFSGCGGSCLGFEMAGFLPIYAVEFVEAARDVYRLNHPGVYVDERDVRKIAAEEILERTELKRGELDVLEGSPPCSSFSTAGARQRKWGQESAYSDTRQRTDDLFFEYVRLVDGLRPKVFVAENVSGLVKGPAFGYFKEILQRLTALGYRVRAKVLDAQWLGVPQQRQRVIFIGVRDDLGVDPPYPSPLAYSYSMREALPWLDSVIWDNSGVVRNKTVTDRPAPTITNAIAGDNLLAKYHFHVRGPEVGDGDAWPEDAVHPLREGSKEGAPARVPFDGTTRLVYRDGFSAGETVGLDEPAPTLMAAGIGGSHRSQLLDEQLRANDAEIEADREKILLGGTQVGVEWDAMRPGQQSGRYFSLVRPDPDRPTPTITALGGKHPGTASVTHPTERRKFTIRELKRLCAFPDDFRLVGKYDQQWERLGRSVPPRMMYAVAREVRDRVFGPRGEVLPGWREAP